MSTQDDARLLGLIATIRRRFGDAVLTDPGRMAALLTDQAPELRPRILAVAAALAAGATPEAAVGGPAPGPAIVHAPPAPGQAPAAPLPDRPDADWIGVSTPVGTPPPPPPPGAAAPYATTPDAPPSPLLATLTRHWRENKYLRYAFVAVAAFLLFRTINASHDAPAPTPVQQPAPPRPVQPAPQQPAPQQPAPQQPAPQPAQPQPPQPRQPQPPAAGALPTLAKAEPYPRLPAQDSANGTLVGFLVQGPAGPLQGVVVVAPNWAAGQIALGQPGASDPDSLSEPGQFATNPVEGGTLRIYTPRWIRDNAHANQVCVIFGRKGPVDPQVHGTRFCLAEAVDSTCRTIIGCGEVG